MSLEIFSTDRNFTKVFDTLRNYFTNTLNLKSPRNIMAFQPRTQTNNLNSRMHSDSYEDRLVSKPRANSTEIHTKSLSPKTNQPLCSKNKQHTKKKLTNTIFLFFQS